MNKEKINTLFETITTILLITIILLLIAHISTYYPLQDAEQMKWDENLKSLNHCNIINMNTQTTKTVPCSMFEETQKTTNFKWDISISDVEAGTPAIPCEWTVTKTLVSESPFRELNLWQVQFSGIYVCEDKRNR